MTWNLGSVHDSVLDTIENVPSYLSGTRLLEIADRQRDFVQQYVGQQIGSNSIPIQFQGPILDLSKSKTLSLMNIEGTDADNVKLGDFSVKKGGNTNLKVESEYFYMSAMDKLKLIGRRRFFGKANG